MLKECYEEALGLLRENRDVMDKIAAQLIEQETITGKEFMRIYREAKGLPEPEEKKDDTDGQTDAKEMAEEKAQDTEKKDAVRVPSPEELRNSAQQQNQPWSMPPAYDWNPEQISRQQNSYPPQGQQNPQQNQQSPYAPQNPQQNPYMQQNRYQDPAQNTNLPEDNGSNGETSRFGVAWDRTVNQDYAQGDDSSQNNGDRW